MTERAARRLAEEAHLPDDSPGSAVRRAPFADNPAVGARGQEAQQRILAAALQVFGDVGYHQCRVHRITELAGCSRVSFYQYFSSKEDLFRHLAGRVARRLAESINELEPITPDAAGREALLGYFERYSAIYDEYQPIFVAFQTAATADALMADGGRRIGIRALDRLEAKIVGSPLTGAELQGAMRTIIESATRANRMYELVVGAEPPVKLTRLRLNQALADVSHRSLFGVMDGVNLTTPAKRPRVFPREAAVAPVDVAEPGTTNGASKPGPEGFQTRTAILEAGHKVYSERGYYATRVDDIVQVAGVSHGVFYRYFKNKDELFRLLARQASVQFTETYDRLAELDPAAPDAREQFRAWLADYAQRCGEAAAIMRVWTDALTRDPELGTDSARVIRDGARGIIELLQHRGSGDVEPEAIVMMVFLEEMTSGRPSQRRTEGIGSTIERSLLFLG